MTAQTTFLTSQNTESKPFIKWAGGKRALIDSIKAFMPKSFDSYFEPFVGGGALFFALKSQGILESKNCILGDKNIELINAYQVIQNNPEALLKELESLQKNHNKEHFYNIRNLDRNEEFKNVDSVFKAARFIYLNKTCFNGLCRYNAKGEFNTPIGSYKNPKIYDKTLMINTAQALQGVKILCGDFSAIIKEARSGDFIYFDPPYYPLNKTSSFVSYTDVFLEKEQKYLARLFKALDSKGIKVLQSNSNTAFIKGLYKNFEITELQAKRAINCKGEKRGKITELLIKGYYE